MPFEDWDYTVQTTMWENRSFFTIEELYQAFKARLIEEMKSEQLPKP